MTDSDINLCESPDSITVLSLRPTKPKHTRTSTRKVRTGCITCKKRHIKCDEARPHCSNCLQSRGHCEGYNLQPRKNARPCQPSRDHAQVVLRAAPPRLQMRLDPDLVDFNDATGVLYFEEFVQFTRAPWNSATVSGHFWATTLPQLARNSNTLRSAAMAIGALAMWHRQSTKGSLRAISVPEMPVNEKDAHYFTAISHYCQSLKLQSRQGSLQDTVMLSVMLLVFETLRDNRKAALDHVNHGLSLLLALVTDDNQQHLASLAPNPKQLLSGLALIFNTLAKQARTVLSGRLEQGPSLPNFTRGLRKNNHTMESFMVLLSQFPSTPVTISEIPAVFSTLDEVDNSWTAIQNAQTIMIHIMVDAMHSSGMVAHWRSVQSNGTQFNNDDGLEKFYLHLIGNDRLREFCEKTHTSLAALNAAFQPLFNEIITTHDIESPLYLKAILLRLQYLGVSILENPPEFIDVASLHARNPLFREYLSVASIALQAARREVEKNPAHQMSLQCELSWQLLIVSLFCRDPLLRDEAIGMLRDYPGQDGLWSTRALHAVAMRNRFVERVNAVEGTPNEQWRRLWRREFVFEDGGDRVVLRYLEKDEATGLWQLVEEMADVRGEAEAVQWKRNSINRHEGLLMVKLYTR